MSIAATHGGAHRAPLTPHPFLELCLRLRALAGRMVSGV